MRIRRDETTDFVKGIIPRSWQDRRRKPRCNDPAIRLVWPLGVRCRVITHAEIFAYILPGVRSRWGPACLRAQCRRCTRLRQGWEKERQKKRAPRRVEVTLCSRAMNYAARRRGRNNSRGDKRGTPKRTHKTGQKATKISTRAHFGVPRDIPTGANLFYMKLRGSLGKLFRTWKKSNEQRKIVINFWRSFFVIILFIFMSGY